MSVQTLGEKYYLQVSDSIKSIFELTTRVDERVQIMMKKQEELEKKLDAAFQQNNNLITRVSVLETTIDSDEISKLKDHFHNLEKKIQDLESRVVKHDNTWKTILDFCFKLAWTMITAYLLFKLGWQSPPS